MRRPLRALLALAALAACDTPTAPLPEAGLPDALEFFIGGFGGISTHVELRRDTLVVRQRPWDWGGGAGVDSTRTVPTAEAWERFWSAARESGVHRWRSAYVARNVVDGTGWGLRIVAGGRVIRSEGSNAYPDRSGSKRDLYETGAFRDFREALSALAGADF